jgi:Rad3-related DNA helicase
MSYSKQLTSIPVVVDYVKRFLDENSDKGFIHAPYALANKLREHFQDHPRVLFHNSSDKMKVFKEYCETPGTVLVASGMYEGVSLDEDLARWQLILKVPWPSLTEPAMEYLAKEDGEYYANRTIKDVVQTYGRVCRGADDYGATYILDATFVRLFKQYRHLFPSWFTEATILEEVT